MIDWQQRRDWGRYLGGVRLSLDGGQRSVDKWSRLYAPNCSNPTKVSDVNEQETGSWLSQFWL